LEIQASELNQKYHKKLKELEDVQKSKSKAALAAAREKLLERKGTKKFYRDLLQFDLDRIQVRLGSLQTGTFGAGDVGSSDPISLAVFAAHFESIAVPPPCEWFNDEHMRRWQDFVSVHAQRDQLDVQGESDSSNRATAGGLEEKGSVDDHSVGG
jgi:hypothetical protein